MRLTREHPVALCALLACASVSWWLTAEQMSGMPASPGADLGTLGWFTETWVVMMAAMMLPSLAPSLAAYLGAARGQAPGRSVLFTCGYVAAWAAAGVVAYTAYQLGHRLLGTELAWEQGGRWLSAAVILTAAGYQFTPVKRVCQRRCRGEVEAGGAGALAVGLRSGGWCIGSSWALMAALFALGAMSITWMVVIAALVAIEKLSPRSLVARLTAAALLIALAGGLLAAPAEIPGFVVPRAGAMHAMSQMG